MPKTVRDSQCVRKIIWERRGSGYHSVLFPIWPHVVVCLLQVVRVQADGRWESTRPPQHNAWPQPNVKGSGVEDIALCVVQLVLSQAQSKLVLCPSYPAGSLCCVGRPESKPLAVLLYPGGCPGCFAFMWALC